MIGFALASGIALVLSFFADRSKTLAAYLKNRDFTVSDPG